MSLLYLFQNLCVGKEVSCKKHENSDDEGEDDAESCGNTSSSSSSSSEDSESDMEDEKDGKPAAFNNNQSSAIQKSSQVYSEANGTSMPLYSSNWHEAHQSISELVGSFKVMDADMGVSSIGNLSPSFESKAGLTNDNLGVDEDMNPVVDFPDTDSTALIKELCAEVFSIEVPGHSDLVSDED